MAESHNLGLKGEELAVEFLEKNGFKILTRNWVRGRNEVDIIAETKEYIVFIEVKTRAVDCLVPPANAVTRDKQKLIIRAAKSYINIFKDRQGSRFDIITVIKKADTFDIEHIPDGIYPTLR